MATQNPALPPGQWVQYNVTTQNPRAKLPTSEEQTVGMIRQSFSKSDGRYYQVVWNPRSDRPKSGLYHESELCPLSQQDAATIAQSGQGLDLSSAGSKFQAPAIPTVALPSQLQGTGQYTSGPPSEDNPSLQEIS